MGKLEALIAGDIDTIALNQIIDKLKEVYDDPNIGDMVNKCIIRIRILAGAIEKDSNKKTNLITAELIKEIRYLEALCYNEGREDSSVFSMFNFFNASKSIAENVEDYIALFKRNDSFMSRFGEISEIIPDMAKDIIVEVFA